MFLVIGPAKSGKDLFCDTASQCFDLGYQGSTGKYLVQQLYMDYSAKRMEQQMEKLFNPIFERLSEKCDGLLDFRTLYENRDIFRKELWAYGEFIRQELGNDAIVKSQIDEGASLINGIRGFDEMQSVVDWFDAVFWIHRPGYSRDTDPTLKFNLNDVLERMENPEHIYIINNLRTTYDFIANTYNLFQEIILPKYQQTRALRSIMR